MKTFTAWNLAIGGSGGGLVARASSRKKRDAPNQGIPKNVILRQGKAGKRTRYPSDGCL